MSDIKDSEILKILLENAETSKVEYKKVGDLSVMEISIEYKKRNNNGINIHIPTETFYTGEQIRKLIDDINENHNTPI